MITFEGLTVNRAALAQPPGASLERRGAGTSRSIANWYLQKVLERYGRPWVRIQVGRWKSVQETRIVYTVFMSLFAAAKIIWRLENIDGPKTSLTH